MLSEPLSTDAFGAPHQFPETPLLDTMTTSMSKEFQNAQELKNQGNEAFRQVCDDVHFLVFDELAIGVLFFSSINIKIITGKHFTCNRMLYLGIGLHDQV
jgi:hypothetical protein